MLHFNCKYRHPVTPFRRLKSAPSLLHPTQLVGGVRIGKVDGTQKHQIADIAQIRETSCARTVRTEGVPPSTLARRASYEPVLAAELSEVFAIRAEDLISIEAPTLANVVRPKAIAIAVTEI